MLLQGELADGLRELLGLKEPIAQEWARGLTDYLRARLGAQEIYIPKPDKAARDRAIYREFDGTNAAAVMQRHGIKSRSRLYQIVHEQRELLQGGGGSPVSSLKTGQVAA